MMRNTFLIIGSNDFWSLITKYILRGGNKSHGKILSKAMELCRIETGDCVWPNVPEKYWAQAVSEMIGLQIDI